MAEINQNSLLKSRLGSDSYWCGKFEWCNNNNGFLTAILSIVGLLISIIEIVVSIQTARLPYKKRLLLGSSFLYSMEMTPEMSPRIFMTGLSVSATNVGNRSVGLTYLGYAIKKDGKFSEIYILDRKFDSRMLFPSEVFEEQFQIKELLEVLIREERSTKIYVFANDTEGTVHKRRAGTVGELIDNLKK